MVAYLKLIMCFITAYLQSTKCDNVSFQNITVRMTKVHFLITVTRKSKIFASNSLVEHLDNSSKITVVDLEGKIPILYRNSITDISFVEFLNVMNNELQDIEAGALHNLQVTRLSFQFNKLVHIREGVFNGLTIDHLILSHNKISLIDEKAFDDMPNLANIDLTVNEIKEINPNWFYNTPRIFRLFLRSNLIEVIPAEAFKNIYNEKRQWINLNNNRIKQVSIDAFKGLKRVDVLDLGTNNLQAWDSQILRDVEDFHDLRLMENKIQCFDDDYEEIFKANVTYVYGNPLKQECKREIEKWMAHEGKGHDVVFEF